MVDRNIRPNRRIVKSGNRITLTDTEIIYLLTVVDDQLKQIGGDPRFAFAREGLLKLKNKLKGNGTKNERH